MPGRWVVVVPVKDATAGKTRLSDALDGRSRAALARAMALDTIAAAVGCPQVGWVMVVTADEDVRREAPALAESLRRTARVSPKVAPLDAPSPAVIASSQVGPLDALSPAVIASSQVATVCVVPEPSHAGQRSGLDAAAAAGVAAGRALAPSARVAVLLGDLPALRPDDLADALVAAGGHERAMVADAAGTGTTLLTVGNGVEFCSRFGVDSALAHVELGYVRLDVEVASTLRHDVDLPVDLVKVRAMRPGPRTARLLDSLPADTERLTGRTA